MAFQFRPVIDVRRLPEPTASFALGPHTIHVHLDPMYYMNAYSFPHVVSHVPIPTFTSQVCVARTRQDSCPHDVPQSLFLVVAAKDGVDALAGEGADAGSVDVKVLGGEAVLVG